MNRYLIQYSYIGTNFRGVQKSINRKINYEGNDHSSVTGALELAIKNQIKPVNDFYLLTSSRTDSGVHALNTSVHVDLKRKNGKPFESSHVTQRLNKYFDKSNVDIRVHNTELVSNDFHARRSVRMRTYLYRLAVDKTLSIKGQTHPSEFYSRFVPLEERNRCYFIRNQNFDVNKAREAAELLVGLHDFRTFMNSSGEEKSKRAFFAKRRLAEVKISPVMPLTVHFQNERNGNNSDFNYFNIEFKAESFIYRQIRKMVGALIAAGEGKLTKRDIYEMLTIPSHHSWKHFIRLAPAHGLYLANVDYGNMDSFKLE